MVWIHCFFHKYHLCIKGALELLDNTAPWCDEDDPLRDTTYSFCVRYFSALATVSNQWRSTGIFGKRVLIACSLFGEDVGVLFTVTIGRCLRGRWGSVDSVERILLSVFPYAHAVSLRLWGLDGTGTGKKKGSV